MLQQEFDQFAENYERLLEQNIRASGEKAAFFAAYKPADMHQHLISAGVDIAALRILDFGCGVGTSLPYLRQYFPGADLIGADVSGESLSIAERKGPAGAKLIHFDGNEALPFEDESIDVAFSACVFHHIPHTEHYRILRELLRVTKPGGWVFIFEHNPLNPLTVQSVNTCPFDKNAVLISARTLKRRLKKAGYISPDARYRIFFPSLLRSLRPLEASLTWCPLGAQYYVVARRAN